MRVRPLGGASPGLGVLCGGQEAAKPVPLSFWGTRRRGPGSIPSSGDGCWWSRLPQRLSGDPGIRIQFAPGSPLCAWVSPSVGTLGSRHKELAGVEWAPPSAL